MQATEKKIFHLSGDLPTICRIFKASGSKVVLTSGNFDLIHDGHTKYLEEAKALGDVLVVGIDNDEAIIKRKGPDRPIRNQIDRAYVIAAFSCVDYVIVFGDYFDLVNTIAPSILVLSQTTGIGCGSLERRKKLIEGIGGKLVLLEPQSSNHSTDMITKIMKITKS